MRELTYKPIETFEKPEVLTFKNVIYWSNETKKLEGVKEGNAIKTKALKFIKLNLVQYDPEFQVFYVNPIKGYNKTRYKIESNRKHFTCSCQFYQKVSQFWEHPICSHCLAIKLWLEIKRHNQRNKTTAEAELQF